MAELIARSVTANLCGFVLPAVAGPVEVVPLAALATEETSENPPGRGEPWRAARRQGRGQLIAQQQEVAGTVRAVEVPASAARRRVLTVLGTGEVPSATGGTGGRGHLRSAVRYFLPWFLTASMEARAASGSR